MGREDHVLVLGQCRALWMPSVYLLFTGVLTGLIWGYASLLDQSLVAIALSWITVFVGIQTLSMNDKIAWPGEIEHILCEYTGAQRVIWLGRGVYKDETSGHVDNLACFIRPGVVALAWTYDKSDSQYEISADAWRRLQLARDARGRRLDVVLLPMPGPMYLTKDEAWGVDAMEGTKPREPGDRLAWPPRSSAWWRSAGCRRPTGMRGGPASWTGRPTSRRTTAERDRTDGPAAPDPSCVQRLLGVYDLEVQGLRSFDRGTRPLA